MRRGLLEVIPAGVSAGRYGGIGRQSEKGIIDADGVILVNVSFFVGNAGCPAVCREQGVAVDIVILADFCAVCIIKCDAIAVPEV